jgi:hypothetical protein
MAGSSSLKVDRRDSILLARFFFVAMPARAAYSPLTSFFMLAVLYLSAIGVRCMYIYVIGVIQKNEEQVHWAAHTR